VNPTRVSAPGSKTVRPVPAHVTLAVVLQVRAERLQVLLWQRAKEPFGGAWALPGGYLEPGETLERSIRRHLAAKVDVRELAHLEQLETRSDPGRHPDEWQLATAYLGLVPTDVDPAVPSDTAWHAVDALPGMAFDHEPISVSSDSPTTLARRIEPYLAHWIGDQGAFIATFADIPTCSLH